MTKEQLLEIAENLGLPPVETQVTLTVKDAPPMEVFALAWDGPNLIVLNTEGQVWTFAGAFATGMKTDVDESALMQVEVERVALMRSSS